jgi:hypothetical protein
LLSAGAIPTGARIATIATEFGQWAVVLVAMHLINVSAVRGLVNTDAMGRMMLTLFAPASLSPD